MYIHNLYGWENEKMYGCCACFATQSNGHKNRYEPSFASNETKLMGFEARFLCALFLLLLLLFCATVFNDLWMFSLNKTCLTFTDWMHCKIVMTLSMLYSLTDGDGVDIFNANSTPCENKNTNFFASKLSVWISQTNLKKEQKLTACDNNKRVLCVWTLNVVALAALLCTIMKMAFILIHSQALLRV